MRTGITINSIQFKTIDKTILCIIKFDLKDKENSIFNNSFIRNNLKMKYKNNTVIGKAVCSKDDDFDEKLGRKIAETRARVKMHNKVRNELSRINKKLYKLSIHSGLTILSNNLAVSRENKFINKILYGID